MLLQELEILEDYLAKGFDGFGKRITLVLMNKLYFQKLIMISEKEVVNINVVTSAENNHEAYKLFNGFWYAYKGKTKYLKVLKTKYRIYNGKKI